MTETKRRIEEYKSRLPKMKEKVAAAIALLLIGAAMMTTVSFAWLAISVNPEVSGVTTALASNGNLEIALATGTQLSPTVPGATQLGDSNKNNVDRNITWGNLINLSDPAYGLENLVLRPAQLNTAELLTSPLFGALYTPDGRLEKLDSSFGYTKWDVEKQMFVHTSALKDQLGVRAISSITKDFSGEQKVRNDLITAAKDKNLEAGAKYASIANNSGQMQSLATMMGLYMTARMNPDEASLNNPTCQQADLQNLAAMYAAFKEAMEIEAEAIAMAINYQLYVTAGKDNYDPYTADEVLALNLAKGKDFTSTSNGKTIKIIKLGTFIQDYKTISSDLILLQNLASQGSVKWSDSGLNNIVNRLTDVGKCTIGADNTPISSIGASNAMGYLSGTQEARITNGILYNFEERTGGYIEVKNLSISATVKRMGITVPATVKANVQTSAPRNYNFYTQDLTYAETLSVVDEVGGEIVANDTYGLAIDLWVRTNAAGGFLTLEGNVLTKTEEVIRTGPDKAGNIVEYYSVKRTEEYTDNEGNSQTEEIEFIIYPFEEEVTENGETQTVTNWYLASTHTKFELQESDTPVKKMDVVQYVVGYEGANRVWEGAPNETITVNSTTQGSGSCYVFYPANSEDQDRTIELLKSMKVAFVDASGNLLAKAIMDTDMRYEQPGKVIVPLVLDPSNSIEVSESMRAITALEKNVATRITAIVYLDGLDVGNEDVLSAAEIQGQMNIQFGSTALLNHAENEELELKNMLISAKLDKTEFKFDDPGEMITNVELTIDGDQPKTVTGYFYREINSTQGSREQMMTFTDPDGDGVWTASYTFTSPGKYVFRSVQVDGTEREISNVEHPRVVVEGFTITELTFTSTTVMTAQSSYTAPMTIAFASSDVNKMPQSVEARFRRDDGTVAAAVFTYNPTTHKWTSDVKFTFSGTYYLNSVYLDGIEQPITGMEKQITLYLGMRVAVYTESPTSFKYIPDEMVKGGYNVLGMQVKIFDNSGEELQGLGDVRLEYALRGTAVKKMDADLTWNAVSGYYEGDFNAIEANVGIFVFLNVKVGSNTITTATTSPTFTIQSPNPPALVAGSVEKTDNLSFVAQMTDTPTSTVVATIRHTFRDKVTTYEVQGVIGTDVTTRSTTPVYTWTFNLPEINGSKDGYWDLVDIKVWNYYDENGVEHRADLEADNVTIKPDKDANGNPIKEVYRDPNPITFVNGEDYTVGGFRIANVQYVTIDKVDLEFTGGTFMTSYNILEGENKAGKVFKVTVRDFEGNDFVGVTKVTMTFNYTEGSSATHGFYTFNEDDANGPTKALTLTLEAETDANGRIVYVHKNAADTVQLAGAYTSTVTVTTGNGNETYTANTPTMTVKTSKPTVTIDSISPSGTHTSASSGGDKNVTSTISNNNKTATVYPKSVCKYSWLPFVGSFVSGATVEAVPMVTLRLDGIGSASKAVLVFSTTDNDGQVLMYTGDNNTGETNAYTWNAGESTCLRYISNINRQDCGGSTFAGTLTSENQITLEYEEIEFKVNIDTITIISKSPE